MIAIHRMRVDCRVPSDHPSPPDVSSLIGRIAEQRVAEALGDHIDHKFPATDNRVIFIRQLQVTAAVDTSINDSLIANAFARAISAGLADVEHDGDGVVCFTDDVEQLACLLVDVAKGIAWTRWYHRLAFPGLVHLSASATIRTLAVDAPQTFSNAATRMTLRSLESVVCALNEIDARRVLASLPNQPPSDQMDPSLPVDTVRTWLDQPRTRTNDLLLILAVRLRSEMARVGDVLAVADAIRTLVGQTPDLGREAAVPVALADLDLTVIERLWSLSPTGGRARARTWNTQHGGIFILLPYLVEAVSTLGGLEPRTGTVTALAGPHACNDPAIQALLGTESKTVSTGAAEGLTDEQHADETIKWLFRSRAIGPVSPRAHRVQVDGCRFTLVIDDLTHHWLGAFKGAANTVATRRIIEQFDPPSHDKLRPRKLSNELRHFTPLEAGLTNTVTAANVMRRMATSLPGFGFTPSTHLWAQALQTSASVAVTADGWEVEVDRSPLAEILRICGHSNRTTFVPWLGNLSVRVVIHR